MMTLLKIAALCFALYLLIVLVAFLGQRRLLYFPDATRIAPAELGLSGVEEHILEADDGVRLVAWWAKAAPGRQTLLYFHGNAGNLAARAERMRRYQRIGRGVLMLSYRGYGGSGGSPSELANVADARLAYERLVGAGVNPADIIVYGESLGSGVAVQLAASQPIGGIVLDAPYTSAVDVGAAAYPLLPVRLLMLDRYDSLARIGSLRAPLLVLHGERDEVVPFPLGRRLFEAAPEPKRLVTFPLAGHSDHHLHGSYEAVEAWLEALPAPGARAGR